MLTHLKHYLYTFTRVYHLIVGKPRCLPLSVGKPRCKPTLVFKFKSFVVARLMCKVGFKWKQLDKRINILGIIVISIIIG